MFQGDSNETNVTKGNKKSTKNCLNITKMPTTITKEIKCDSSAIYKNNSNNIT